MSDSINLRDTLLAALVRLPGTREFHLHVLITSPRKNASLFPFAHPRPRAYLQDVLVLLSEQSTPDAPRKFVAGIEASIYNVTSTSCVILHISKLDSTGHGTAPSPTYCLIKTFLSYYADPKTRPVAGVEHLWIHLFARAQAQYMFPNSAEFEGKHPLSDIKLCAWWKRVFTDVARDLDEASTTNRKLYYILPGYSEFEAVHALKNASSSSLPVDGPTWIYGHPYSQTEITLPCPPDLSEEKKKNLGHFIPSFDDDPKSRFMDEIAYTTEGDIKSPRRKRKRTASHGGGPHAEGAEEKEDKEGKDDLPLGDLRKVTPDEFWERMSFRQECVAGAVTGFFTLGITSPSSSTSRDRSAVSPLAPQRGQVSSQLNKRILTTLTTSVEFSTVERAIRGTEIVEGAIRGLCEGIAPIPTTSTHGTRALPLVRDVDRRTPERETSTLLAPPPPRTPPPRRVDGKRVIPDVSPNPFPEPEASLEIYYSHIYGSVCVRNEGGLERKTESRPAPVVTVLAVRKKKKRSD